MAPAPVCHAESSHSRVFSRGEGRPARTRALFRWLGSHAPDCSPSQDPVGPVLQDNRGESLHEWAEIGT